MKDYYCSRCVYEWEGQPICPMCSQEYTHYKNRYGEEIESDTDLKAVQDCIDDTRKHQDTVRELVLGIIGELNQRAQLHDASKLWPEEIEGFVKYTPKLKECTYGSDEYKQYLKELEPYLKHHYKHNRHHPEKFEDHKESYCISCKNAVTDYDIEISNKVGKCSKCGKGKPTFDTRYTLRGMNLVDVLEMLCDWKAASIRHNDGDILKSLEIQKTRFGISDELYQILRNTIIDVIDKKDKIKDKAE